VDSTQTKQGLGLADWLRFISAHAPTLQPVGCYEHHCARADDTQNNMIAGAARLRVSEGSMKSRAVRWSPFEVDDIVDEVAVGVLLHEHRVALVQQQADHELQWRTQGESGSRSEQYGRQHTAYMQRPRSLPTGCVARSIPRIAHSVAAAVRSTANEAAKGSPLSTAAKPCMIMQSSTHACPVRSETCKVYLERLVRAAGDGGAKLLPRRRGVQRGGVRRRPVRQRAVPHGRHAVLLHRLQLR